MKERVYTITLTEKELLLLLVVINIAKVETAEAYSEATMLEAEEFITEFEPLLQLTLQVQT